MANMNDMTIAEWRDMSNAARLRWVLNTVPLPLLKPDRVLINHLLLEQHKETQQRKAA